jgi:endo-1,4-beta-mannosidase
VNYFDAFYRTVRSKGTDKTYREGLTVLGTLGIPFIRFNLVGYDASEWSFALEQQTEYLALLDEFLAECEKQKIGVIPSFFWNYLSLSNYCNEDYHQWGNTNSETFKTMQAFTTVIFERYKESPVIWGWEAGNELALETVIPDQYKSDPYSLTVAECATVYQGFSAIVRKLDPYDRLLSTGDGMPHPASYHLTKEGTWTSDSLAEHATFLKELYPTDYVMSLHIYPSVETGWGGVAYFGQDTFKEIIASYMEVAKQMNRVCFVGEFGVSASENFEGDTEL